MTLHTSATISQAVAISQCTCLLPEFRVVGDNKDLEVVNEPSFAQEALWRAWVECTSQMT